MLSPLMANPLLADEYSEAQAKALALMVMRDGAALSTSLPHNWCHCGNCESIAKAQDKALAIIKKADCPCKEDCLCKQGECPNCPTVKYAWKHRAGEPGKRYLYAGDKALGMYDTGKRSYRPYQIGTTKLGPAGKCPCPPPASKPPRSADEKTKIASAQRSIQCNAQGCTIGPAAAPNDAGGCASCGGGSRGLARR